MSSLTQRLPEDVLVAILVALDRASLKCVSLVSKYLTSLADHLLFYNLTVPKPYTNNYNVPSRCSNAVARLHVTSGSTIPSFFADTTTQEPEPSFSTALHSMPRLREIHLSPAATARFLEPLIENLATRRGDKSFRLHLGVGRNLPPLWFLFTIDNPVPFRDIVVTFTPTNNPIDATLLILGLFAKCRRTLRSLEIMNGTLLLLRAIAEMLTDYPISTLRRFHFHSHETRHLSIPQLTTMLRRHPQLTSLGLQANVSVNHTVVNSLVNLTKLHLDEDSMQGMAHRSHASTVILVLSGTIQTDLVASVERSRLFEIPNLRIVVKQMQPESIYSLLLPCLGELLGNIRSLSLCIRNGTRKVIFPRAIRSK